MVASSAQDGTDPNNIFTAWAEGYTLTGFAARSRFANSGGVGSAAAVMSWVAIGR